MAIRRLGAPRKSNPTPRKTKLKRLARALTPKQRIFVERYLLTYNATQAYREAFEGVTYGTAMTQGNALLKHPVIAAEVKQRLGAQLKRYAPEQANVVEQLCNEAFSDIRDVLDANGALIPVHNLPVRVTRAMKKLKSKEITAIDLTSGEEKVIGHTHEIEMKDSLGALRMLGAHLGMAAEKHDHDVKVSFADLLRRRREKLIPVE